MMYALAAGFGYQYLGTKWDEMRNPPPGEMVDVGGYKLHLNTQGEAPPGVPTVIIESGIWDCSQSWQLVQADLAKVTRVCTYDRAGYGWSEAGPGPRTFDRMVKELKTLLVKKEIHPPYLFVGHSLGGPIARYYHSQYPEEVEGMVFVDALHLSVPTLADSTLYRIAMAATYCLAQVGLWRLTVNFLPAISANPKWTEEMQKTLMACHQAKTSTFKTCFQEWNGYAQSFQLLREHRRSLAEIPVTLISQDFKMNPRMKELDEYQKGLKEESPHADLVIASQSNHCVQIDRPDIIILEVKRMLNKLSKL